MRVVVFSGPCGAGKTTLRHKQYGDTPCFDMADAKRYPDDGKFDAWLRRMHELFDSIHAAQMAGQELFLVEGVFAPGSKGRARLEGFCADIGADIEYVVPRIPSLPICLVRLLADYIKDGDVERLRGRAEALVITYPSFQ